MRRTVDREGDQDVWKQIDATQCSILIPLDKQALISRTFEAFSAGINSFFVTRIYSRLTFANESHTNGEVDLIR